MYRVSNEKQVGSGQAVLRYFPNKLTKTNIQIWLSQMPMGLLVFTSFYGIALSRIDFIDLLIEDCLQAQSTMSGDLRA